MSDYLAALQIRAPAAGGPAQSREEAMRRLLGTDTLRRIDSTRRYGAVVLRRRAPRSTRRRVG